MNTNSTKNVRLSQLSVNVVLDHAGGHDSVERQAMFRRKSLLTEKKTASKLSTDIVMPTNAAPTNNANNSLRPQDRQGEKIMVSPIKKRNKKLYISLKDNNDPSVSKPANFSREKLSLPSKDSALPSSPLRRLRHTATLPRRNSTGSNNFAPRLNMSTDVPRRRQVARSQSLRSLHQLSPAVQGDVFVAEMEKFTETKLIDSPPGPYHRAPRGYMPLYPIPDLCSVTSASTNSSHGWSQGSSNNSGRATSPAPTSLMSSAVPMRKKK